MILVQGNQINVRDWQIGDLDDYAHWQHPDHAWHRLDGPYYAKPKPEDIPAMIKKIRSIVEKADWPTPRKRLVIADRETDQLIGTVSWYWIGEETNWLAQGIVIFNEKYWGRGIGTEALGLWSQYLLDNMPQIVRLDLRTWSGNHGMIGLARKLGYHEEARFRNARVVDDQYYDGLGFGILREEWESRYPKGFSMHRVAY